MFDLKVFFFFLISLSFVSQWINTGRPESQCHGRNLPKEGGSLMPNLVLGFMLTSVCIPEWPLLPGDGSLV